MATKTNQNYFIFRYNFYPNDQEIWSNMALPIIFISARKFMDSIFTFKPFCSFLAQFLFKELVYKTEISNRPFLNQL